MTIEEIRKYNREWLTPKQVAPVLGVMPYSINVQVKQDIANGTKSFPFDVILVGSRVKIMRKSFLKAIDGEVST